MSEPTPLSARKVQQALAYLAGLHGDDPQRVQQVHGQLLRWRNKSGEHERAWQEAEKRWQEVHRLTPHLRAAVAPEPLSLSRRRLLRQGGGLLVLVASSGWLGWLWRRRPQFDQVLLTEHAAPPRSIELPDGSQMLMAAESNLQVRYSNGQREVMLPHGNVYFDVAHELLRSFVVSTRLGQVEVLGTAFSVSDRGVGIQVSVARGRVRVRGFDGAEQVLQAGERISLSEQGRLGVPHKHLQAAPNAEHWRKGWWSFTDAPLAQVVGEINAYTEKPVALDANVADLRLTGSFPSDQPQVLLQTLPRILPVVLVRHGEGHLLQRR
jgi:transmembrane sensor